MKAKRRKNTEKNIIRSQLSSIQMDLQIKKDQGFIKGVAITFRDVSF